MQTGAIPINIGKVMASRQEVVGSKYSERGLAETFLSQGKSKRDEV